MVTGPAASLRRRERAFRDDPPRNAWVMRLAMSSLATAVVVVSPDSSVPVAAFALAWAWLAASTLGGRIRARRAGRDGVDLPAWVYLVDGVVVLGGIAPTGGADSPLRWVLLAVPPLWATLQLPRPRATLALVAAGYVGAALPGVLDDAYDARRAVEFLLLYLGAAVLLCGTVEARRRQHALETAVEDTRIAHALELLQMERQHQEDLAVRLHDGPLQLTLSAYQDVLELQAGEDVDLERLLETLRQNVAQTRSLNAALYDAVLRDAGFAAAIEHVALAVRRNGGPVVRTAVGADASSSRDEALLAIVDELLTNVRKHAGAARAEVTVRRTSAAKIEVVVRDDGIGLTPQAETDAARRGHIGLRSVRRRAAELGGALEIEHPPAGTSIRITVPADPPATGIPQERPGSGA